MRARTAVIVGNGPSAAAPRAGAILASDFILRTNNFFLEPKALLGARVDLAMVAGDPRVAPFVFATLRHCADIYDIRAWSAVKQPVIGAGLRTMRAPFVPMQTATSDLEADVQAFSHKHGAEPGAAVQAMLLAHALGFENLILLGVDLYAGPRRYAFATGRHMKDILGQDLDHRPYDPMHSEALDRAVIAKVAALPGVVVSCGSEMSPLSRDLDLSPVRQGAPVRPVPKRQVDDWVPWAGAYPIWGLKLMRTGRRALRRVSEHAGRGISRKSSQKSPPI
ncbi:MAG: hypothetical protein JXR14_05960 [Paracoccaceae bacterium]